MNAVGIDELLTNEQSTSLFEEIAFADRHAARSCLQRMATAQGVPRALSAALLPLLRALKVLRITNGQKKQLSIIQYGQKKYFLF